MADKASWEEAAKQEKRQLLLRAALAGGVIVTMLAGLVFWERSKQQEAAVEAVHGAPSPREVRSQIQSAPVVEQVAESAPARSEPEEKKEEKPEPKSEASVPACPRSPWKLVKRSRSGS